MKNEPRYVPPGGAVMEVSNRTQQGRFLLLPSVETKDLILGVLGRAQRLYGVTIFAFQFLSDHYHMLVWALDARQLAGFMNYVDGNIAIKLGKLHGWEGKFWRGTYFSAVVKDTAESQLERLRYILSNGCKEGLVASPTDWPGASSTPALLDGSMQLPGNWLNRTAECRARAKGKSIRCLEPEIVRLSPLPCLEGLSDSAFRAEIAAIVRDIEAETRRRHELRGSQPLGAERVIRQHPHQRPQRLARTRARRFLAAPGESVLEELESYERFLEDYRDAATRLREGERDVVFPFGCFPPRLPFTRAGPTP